MIAAQAFGGHSAASPAAGSVPNAMLSTDRIFGTLGTRELTNSSWERRSACKNMEDYKGQETLSLVGRTMGYSALELQTGWGTTYSTTEPQGVLISHDGDMILNYSASGPKDFYSATVPQGVLFEGGQCEWTGAIRRRLYVLMVAWPQAHEHLSQKGDDGYEARTGMTSQETDQRMSAGHTSATKRLGIFETSNEDTVQDQRNSAGHTNTARKRCSKDQKGVRHFNDKARDSNDEQVAINDDECNVSQSLRTLPLLPPSGPRCSKQV